MGNMNREFLLEVVKDYQSQVSEANNAARLNELDKYLKITPFNVKSYTLEQCFALAYYNEAFASRLLNKRKFFQRLQNSQSVKKTRKKSNNKSLDLDSHFQKLEAKYAYNLNILDLISKNTQRKCFPQGTVDNLLTKYVYTRNSKIATSNFRCLFINFLGEIINGISSERDICLIRKWVVRDPQINRWLKNDVKNNPKENSVKFLVTVASTKTINKILNPSFFSRLTNLFSNTKLACEYVTAKDLIARIKFEYQYSVDNNLKFDTTLIESFLNSNILQKDLWRKADESDWREIILIIDQLCDKKDNKLLKLAKSRFEEKFPKKLNDLEIDVWKISEPHSVGGFDSASSTPRGTSSGRSSAGIEELSAGGVQSSATFLDHNNLAARIDVDGLDSSSDRVIQGSSFSKVADNQIITLNTDTPEFPTLVPGGVRSHSAEILASPASFGLQEFFSPPPPAVEIDGLASPRSLVPTLDLSAVKAPLVAEPGEVDGLNSPRPSLPLTGVSKSAPLVSEPAEVDGLNSPRHHATTRDVPVEMEPSIAKSGEVDGLNSPRPSLPLTGVSESAPLVSEPAEVDGLNSPRHHSPMRDVPVEMEPSIAKSGEVDGLNSPRPYLPTTGEQEGAASPKAVLAAPGTPVALPVEEAGLRSHQVQASPKLSTPVKPALPEVAPATVDGLKSPQPQPSPAVVQEVASPKAVLAAPGTPVALPVEEAGLRSPQAQASPKISTPVKPALPDVALANMDGLKSPQPQPSPAVVQEAASPKAVLAAPGTPVALPVEEAGLRSPQVQASPKLSTPVKPALPEVAPAAVDGLKSPQHQASPAVVQEAASPKAVLAAPGTPVALPVQASPKLSTPVKPALPEVAPAAVDGLKSPQPQPSPAVVQEAASPKAVPAVPVTPVAVPAEVTGLRSPEAQVKSNSVKKALFNDEQVEIEGFNSPQHHASPTVLPTGTAPSVAAAAEIGGLNSPVGFNSPQYHASPAVLPTGKIPPVAAAAEIDGLNSPDGFNTPQKQDSVGGFSSPKARTPQVDGLPSPIPKRDVSNDGFASPIVPMTPAALPADPVIDGFASPLVGEIPLAPGNDVTHLSSATPPPKQPVPKMTAEQRREAYKQDPNSTPNVMKDDMDEFSFNDSTPTQSTPKKDSARKKFMQRSAQSSPSIFKLAPKKLVSESFVHDPAFTENQYKRMKRLFGESLEPINAEMLWFKFYKDTPAFDATLVKNKEFTEQIYYRVITSHDKYLETSEAERIWESNKNKYQNESDDESNNSLDNQHDSDDEDKSDSSHCRSPGMQARV